MRKFVTKYFSKFLNDETMAKVLKEIDMPDHKSIHVPKLNEDFAFMVDSDGRLLKNDKSLAKVQGTFMRALGPLYLVWKEIDNSIRNEEHKAMSMNDMCLLF